MKTGLFMHVIIKLIFFFHTCWINIFSAETLDGVDTAAYQETASKTSVENFKRVNVSDQFGKVMIKRISNKTDFSMQLDFSGEKSLLPDGSLVRLQVSSSRYSDKKPFVAVKESKDNSGGSNLLLRADCYDADDKKCHFLISNFVDNQGDASLILSPFEYPANKIQVSESSKDKTLVFVGPDNSSSQNGLGFRWKLEGSFEKAYFKNMLGGYMGPSMSLDAESGSVLTRFNFKESFRTKIDYEKDSVKYLNSGNQFQNDMQYFFWLYGRTFREMPQKFDLQKIQKISDQVKKKIVLCKKKPQENCCYGDCIVLKSAHSYQDLVVCDDVDKKKVLCLDSLFFGGADASEDDYLFLIKGEHSELDKNNYVLGSPIKNGDSIRLEHVASGKNLSVSNELVKDDDFVFLVKKDSAKMLDYERRSLKLNGSFGKGDFSDNWVVTFLENQNNLSLGTNIVLYHPVTNSWLATDFATSKKTKNMKQIIFAVNKKQQAQERDQASIVAQATSQAKNSKPSSSSLPSKENTNFDEQQDLFKEEKSWFFNLVKKFGVVEKDLIRTGFKQGAFFEKIETDFPDNQALKVDVIKLGASDIVAPRSDAWKDFPLFQSPLQLRGSFKEEPVKIMAGYWLNLNPMLDKGIAWLEKSLLLPNRFSLKFFTKVADEGGCAIVLGKNLTEQYFYKIVLGYKNNLSTAILKSVIAEDGKSKDVELVKIFSSDAPLAALKPGVVSPVWLVFDNGLFLLGQSTQIGENLFFAYQDLDFNKEVSRVGFSCDKSKLFLSDIQISAPLEITDPVKKYETLNKVEKGKLYRSGFRSLDEVLLNFFCVDLMKEEIRLVSQSDPLKGYSLEVDALNQIVRIFKSVGYAEEKKIFEQDNLVLAKKKHSSVKMWLSYNNGLFSLGFDEVGKDVAFVFKDEDPLSDISAWMLDSKQSSVKTVDCYSKMGFDFAKTKFDAVFSQDNLSQKVIGVFPYDYKVYQENERVFVQDFVSPKNFLVASAPQKNAIYSMMLTLENNGVPKMRWAWQPENSDLINLRWQSMVASSAAQALNMGASHMMGSGQVGGAVAAVVNVATTAASIPLAYLAASLKIKANKDYGIVSDQVLIENASNQSIEKSSNADLPPEAIDNRYRLEQILDETRKFSPSTRETFFLILSKYKECVNLIKHPYVIGTVQLKSNLLSGVSDLITYHGELFEKDFESEINQSKSGVVFIDNSFQEMIDFLVNAAQNLYLLDLSLPIDVALKNQWLAAANLLLRKVLKKQADQEVTINPMFGEFFWLEDQLPMPGQGKVYFSVKGASTFHLAFASSMKKFVGTPTLFYEIVFSNAEISCFVRLSSFGSLAAKSTDERLRLSEIDFCDYWISLDKGKISVGRINENGEEEKLLTFDDLYPTNDEKFIGIGTWNSSVDLKGIKVSSIVHSENDATSSSANVLISNSEDQ